MTASSSVARITAIIIIIIGLITMTTQSRSKFTIIIQDWCVPKIRTQYLIDVWCVPINTYTQQEKKSKNVFNNKGVGRNKR